MVGCPEFFLLREGRKVEIVWLVAKWNSFPLPPKQFLDGLNGSKGTTGEEMFPNWSGKFRRIRRPTPLRFVRFRYLRISHTWNFTVRLGKIIREPTYQLPSHFNYWKINFCCRSRGAKLWSSIVTLLCTPPPKKNCYSSTRSRKLVFPSPVEKCYLRDSSI